MESNKKSKNPVTSKQVTLTDQKNGLSFDGTLDESKLPQLGVLKFISGDYSYIMKGNFKFDENEKILFDGTLEKKAKGINFEFEKITKNKPVDGYIVTIEKDGCIFTHGFTIIDENKIAPQIYFLCQYQNQHLELYYKRSNADEVLVSDDDGNNSVFVPLEKWKNNNKNGKNKLAVAKITQGGFLTKSEIGEGNSVISDTLREIEDVLEKAKAKITNPDQETRWKVINYPIGNDYSLTYDGDLQNRIPHGVGSIKITNKKGDITKYQCLFNKGKIEKYQKVSLQERTPDGKQLKKEITQKYNVITRDGQILEDLNDIENIEKNIEIIKSNNKSNNDKSNSEINNSDLDDLLGFIDAPQNKSNKNKNDNIAKRNSLFIENQFEILGKGSLANDTIPEENDKNNTIQDLEKSLFNSNTPNKENNVSVIFGNLSNIEKLDLSSSLFDNNNQIEEEKKEYDNQEYETYRTLDFSSNINLNLTNANKGKKEEVAIDEKIFIIPVNETLNRAIRVKLDPKIKKKLDSITFLIVKSALDIAEINGTKGQEEKGTCFKVTKNGVYELKIQGRNIQNCRIFGSVDEEGVLILNDLMLVKDMKHNNNSETIYNNMLNRQGKPVLIDLSKEISGDSNTFNQSINRTNPPHTTFTNNKGFNQKNQGNNKLNKTTGNFNNQK